MKQVILMRTDLGMSTGKMCAQAAHASINSKVPCVVVKVDRQKLTECLTEANSLRTRWVFDAGHTEVPEGTFTCGAIYGNDKAVDKITGQLPLL